MRRMHRMRANVRTCTNDEIYDVFDETVARDRLRHMGRAVPRRGSAPLAAVGQTRSDPPQGGAPRAARLRAVAQVARVRSVVRVRTAAKPEFGSARRLGGGNAGRALRVAERGDSLEYGEILVEMPQGPARAQERERDRGRR